MSCHVEALSSARFADSARWIRVGRALSALALMGATGCRESPRAQTAPPEPATLAPSLRLVILSTLAGALEPCGCRKDMLGGLDHAAPLVTAARREAQHTLVVAAGATFFLNPHLGEQSAAQEQWKAESIARGLKVLGLNALTPGVNDWAAGPETLEQLLQLTGASVLASNLQASNLQELPSAALAAPRASAEVASPSDGSPDREGATAPSDPATGPTAPVLARRFVAQRVIELGGQRVGLLGLTLMGRSTSSDVVLPGLNVERDAQAVLRRQLASLSAQGAQIMVGLFAGDRGSALRAAESAPGLDVLVVGKDRDQGEANDAFKEPELVGETLVVEAPNHLQALVLLDLFVKGGDLSFADGSGLARARERASTRRSIEDLERRLETWRASPSTNPADVAARERDLSAKREALAALEAEPPVPQGSYFRVRTETVREALGVDEAVHAQMLSYYKRVNEHNREAFAGRKPPPVPAGAASFVGVDACESCHEEAVAFWRQTPHASAYPTLEKDHKQFNLECVSCHVTGYEQPGGSTVTHVTDLRGVQCEECHGPGSLHAKDGETQFIRLDPGPDVCVKCHHEPHVLESWKVEVARPNILGPGHGG